ncbi:MAG: WbuC family cupin fold metalloprotein [Polynucleobacter sp.]|nr:WbuC family cupin fold metalloprotein [Polynucleobacter sp.]
MKLIQILQDVYVANQPISKIGCEEIEFLRSKLNQSKKGRVRINLHHEPSDLLHEMIIAISGESYIRPHKHLNKSESFHIIYGEVDVIIFDDVGHLMEVITLSSNSKIYPFFYRMSKPFFHTLNIRSEILIVHEVTNGPFIEGATLYGQFSPDEGCILEIKIWKENLSRMMKGLS